MNIVLRLLMRKEGALTTARLLLLRADNCLEDVKESILFWEALRRFLDVGVAPLHLYTVRSSCFTQFRTKDQFFPHKDILFS